MSGIEGDIKAAERPCEECRKDPNVYFLGVKFASNEHTNYQAAVCLKSAETMHNIYTKVLGLHACVFSCPSEIAYPFVLMRLLGLAEDGASLYEELFETGKVVQVHLNKVKEDSVEGLMEMDACDGLVN